MIAKAKDELGEVEKILIWSLMPPIFGDHWGPHSTSPADSALDTPAPLGRRTYGESEGV